MTRDDAIYYLQSSGFSEEQINEIEQGFRQKSCEDAISRQAVLDLAYDMSEIDGEHFTEPYMVVDVEDIQKLPSVKPQEPKTGRWIESNGVGMFVCSVCNESFYPMPTCMGKPLMEYCPNCGCRMVEPKESEEISDRNLKMWEEIFKAERSDKE